jgi:transposase
LEVDLAEFSLSKRTAAIYSRIGSAKLNGIDPEPYLRGALTGVAGPPVSRINELLPWNSAPQLAPLT